MTSLYSWSFRGKPAHTHTHIHTLGHNYIVLFTAPVFGTQHWLLMQTFFLKPTITSSCLILTSRANQSHLHSELQNQLLSSQGQEWPWLHSEHRHTPASLKAPGSSERLITPERSLSWFMYTFCRRNREINRGDWSFTGTRTNTGVNHVVFTCSRKRRPVPTCHLFMLFHRYLNSWKPSLPVLSLWEGGVKDNMRTSQILS